MTNLPANYDEWRLRGPDEHDDPEMVVCPSCDGDGHIERYNTVFACGRCCGSGEVSEPLDVLDEDYEYERRRDAAWEDQT